MRWGWVLCVLLAVGCGPRLMSGSSGSGSMSREQAGNELRQYVYLQESDLFTMLDTLPGLVHFLAEHTNDATEAENVTVLNAVGAFRSASDRWHYARSSWETEFNRAGAGLPSAMEAVSRDMLRSYDDACKAYADIAYTLHAVAQRLGLGLPRLAQTQYVTAMWASLQAGP